MKRAVWLWALLALLLLSLGLNLGLLLGRWRSAPATPPGTPRLEMHAPFPDGPRDRPVPEGALRIGERLGLDGEELDTFVAIQEEFLRGMAEARRRQRLARHELRRELTSSRPDPARIRARIEESAEIAASIDRLLADHVLESREVLDGDAEERYLRFLGRLGGGGPPGPRPRLGRPLRP